MLHVRRISALSETSASMLTKATMKRLAAPSLTLSVTPMERYGPVPPVRDRNGDAQASCLTGIAGAADAGASSAAAPMSPTERMPDTPSTSMERVMRIEASRMVMRLGLAARWVMHVLLVRRRPRSSRYVAWAG